jgi:hypothetical protein
MWTSLRLWKILLCCSVYENGCFGMWVPVFRRDLPVTISTLKPWRWNMFYRKVGIIYQITPCRNKEGTDMNLTLNTRNITAGRSVFEIINCSEDFLISNFYLFSFSFLPSLPTSFPFLRLPPLYTYKIIGHIFCSVLHNECQASYSIRS